MKLKDIQNSFNISCKNYKKKHLSKHWLKNNKKKKVLFDIKNLDNFRINGLADGLGGGYFSKKHIKIMYNLLAKEIGIKKLFQNLIKKNIGNYNNILKTRGKIIDANQLLSLKWLFDLKKKIEINKLKIICEIGAGYGCFAEKLIKNTNAKYIIIDLPEANFVSSYYLKNFFPKKKFLLESDIKNKKLNFKMIDRHDIIIINPWRKLPNIAIDLFINIRSMMEMDKSTIKSYFNLINQKIRINGYFLNINRYEKDTVGDSIQISNYPYGKKWSVLLSKNSWQQNHTHYLLTKKINNVGDVQNELNKINQIKLKRKFKIDKYFLKKYLPNFLYQFLRRTKYLLLDEKKINYFRFK